ncbi:MAG: TRAP transporter small permease [Candidatus Nitronauta litoralis]|uniref:TRAP transporter small permease n=1 Tax=Candidatus Nitronauta litoralis TaxID=2705533 RepID=A0A7T0BYE6_9BACT|nr:MAG: TRAP transporter small permease [Candidatus Nitronauta litoralis]
MRILRSFDTLLARVETFFLILVLIALVSLSFGQVVLRNFFNEGFLWADTLCRQLVLWVGFLGASLAVHENRHLSIDFIPHLVSPQVRRWLKVISRLAAAIISLFLAKAALEFLVFEREGEATLFAEIPTWWFQTILPYSLTIIGVRFLFTAWDAFRQTESSK